MTATPAYRASTINTKRQRRTHAQMDQLDAQIMAVLADDHPQSVRHVFYRCTDPRLPAPVEKSDRSYRHVQDRCAKLRRAGKLPYGWIADMSRRGYFVNTFDGASDFVRRMSGLYRADLWRDAECRCELWVESRSIASVLIDDCREVAVSLFPCWGFSSMTFVHKAAEEHNDSADDRPLVVLFVGDLDPAGVLIDQSLKRELRLHLRSDIDLSFRRVGINVEQVKQYDLPTEPPKATDRRSLEIEYAVEAESLPASILRSLVRAEVEALLPEGALAVSKVAEQSERAHLRRMATLLDGRQA